MNVNKIQLSNNFSPCIQGIAEYNDRIITEVDSISHDERDIARDTEGNYLIVGTNSGTSNKPVYIRYTKDFSTFTNIVDYTSSGQKLIGAGLNNIIYDSLSNRFIAVGKNGIFCQGIGKSFTSINNWSKSTIGYSATSDSSPSGVYYFSIAQSAKYKLFITVGYIGENASEQSGKTGYVFINGDNVISWTRNGKTYSTSGNKQWIHAFTIPYTLLRYVIYNEVDERVVIVGDYDVIMWFDLKTLPKNSSGYDYSPMLYIDNWKGKKTPINTLPHHQFIMYDNLTNLYIVIGNNCLVYVSSDLDNWTRIITGFEDKPYNLQSIAYDSKLKLYIICGSNNSIIYTKDIFTPWTLFVCDDTSSTKNTTQLENTLQYVHYDDYAGTVILGKYVFTRITDKITIPDKYLFMDREFNDTLYRVGTTIVSDEENDSLLDFGIGNWQKLYRNDIQKYIYTRIL